MVTWYKFGLVLIYSRNYAAGIHGNYRESSDCFEYPSLCTRCLEVVGKRKNGRARRRHARGEGACLPQARPFSLSPTTSKHLLRRLSIPKKILTALLKSSYQKYLPSFPTKKNPEIENFKPQKSFDHPCHLKSEYPSHFFHVLCKPLKFQKYLFSQNIRLTKKL